MSLSEEGRVILVMGQKGESTVACETMEEPKAQSGESRIAVPLGTDRMGKGVRHVGA